MATRSTDSTVRGTAVRGPTSARGDRAGSGRRALRLGKRDKIRYSIRPSCEVVLTRSTSPEGLEADDPVLGQFLGFLARDMASHPERLQAVDAGLVDRLQSLVGGIEVDLDAALSANDK
jgi:antitoxin PrlF